MIRCPSCSQECQTVTSTRCPSCGANLLARRSPAGGRRLGRTAWLAIALAGVAAAALGVAALTRSPASPAPASVDDAPASLPAAVAPPPPVVEVSSAGRKAGDSDVQELTALRLRVAELEVELQRTRHDLAVARDEATRYKDGLERAVDQLNIQARAPRRIVRSGGAAPPRSTYRASDQAVLHTPYLIFMNSGTRLRVSGEVYNPTDEVIGGDVVVEVDEGQGPREVARIPLEIPPGSRRGYSEEIWGIASMGDGPTADVVWEGD